MKETTQNTVQIIQNTIKISTHITKTPTRCKTYTYTHPRISTRYTPNENARIHSYERRQDLGGIF